MRAAVARRVAWALLVLSMCGCFGARSVRRNYYVLHAQRNALLTPSSIRGLVRVRDLNAESIYEKFQIVIRNSPFQLRYSGANLWAVRPNVMIADIIGRILQERGVFTGVTRDLSDARPDYTLAGELSALEVYDSDEVWYAHLAISLGVYRFHDGERVWRYVFDERKPVGTTDMPHAVRAMSELLQQALHEAVAHLHHTVDLGHASAAANPHVLTRSVIQRDGMEPIQLEMVPNGAPIPRSMVVEPPEVRTSDPFVVESSSSVNKSPRVP